MSWLTRRVIVPPYCGVPSLSHQFPVVVIVVVVAALVGVVAGAVVGVVAGAVVGVVVGAVVGVVVDVVDVAQDASSIPAIIKKLNPNQTILFLTFSTSILIN